MSEMTDEQAAIANSTKRLVNKYVTVSDHDHPLIVTYAAAELIGLTLPYLKKQAPEAFSQTLAWLRAGLDQIEGQA